MARQFTMPVFTLSMVVGLLVRAALGAEDVPPYPMLSGNEFPLPIDALIADGPWGPVPFPPPPYGGPRGHFHGHLPPRPPPPGPRPPFPPPPPPPGAVELALKLLAAIGSGVQEFYSDAAKNVDLNDSTCGNCVEQQVKVLIDEVAEEVKEICDDDSEKEPPFAHFCKLFSRMPPFVTIAIMSRAKVNPLSLVVTRCASAGPCALQPSNSSLLASGSSLLLLAQDAEAAPEMDEGNVGPQSHNGCFMKWLFGGSQTQRQQWPGHHVMPRRGMGAAGASAALAATGETELAGSGPLLDAFMSFVTEGYETDACQTCITSGVKLFFEDVSAKIGWVCANSRIRPIQALCGFTRDYPLAAAVAITLKLKPWRKIVPGCFFIKACDLPPPPPGPPSRPPPPPPGARPLPIFPVLDLDIFSPPPPPPPLAWGIRGFLHRLFG